MHVAAVLLVVCAWAYIANDKPRVDDPLDFSTPAPRPIDDPGNAAIREAAVQQFRGASPLMVSTWPRKDEFWISAGDRRVDWQQRADGACAWIRSRGMRGRFSVQVVEMAALNNRRVEQLAYARCAE